MTGAMPAGGTITEDVITVNAVIVAIIGTAAAGVTGAGGTVAHIIDHRRRRRRITIVAHIMIMAIMDTIAAVVRIAGTVVMMDAGGTAIIAVEPASVRHKKRGSANCPVFLG